MTLKILITDDHTIVREGFKQILDDASDTFIVGEAVNGNDALNQVREEHWDVLILDMSMPGKCGLEVLKQLRYECPQLPILILSLHSEEYYAMRVLKGGASGYLTKNCSPEQLIMAIHKVANGRKFITPSLAEQLAETLNSDPDKAPHEALTNREFQIFNLLASGKTVSEIATQLALSVKTISTHRAKILKKMNMKNNAELMYYAIRKELASEI